MVTLRRTTRWRRTRSLLPPTLPPPMPPFTPTRSALLPPPPLLPKRGT